MTVLKLFKKKLKGDMTEASTMQGLEKKQIENLTSFPTVLEPECPQSKLVGRRCWMALHMPRSQPANPNVEAKVGFGP